MLKIIKLINSPITSNGYVIHHQNNEHCIVIDPGSENISIFQDHIGNKKVDFIILTHEHFDHIWGADEIRKNYNAQLCCSKETNWAIVNKKKNLSLFYNQIGFELLPCDIILANEQIVDWHGIDIFVIATPGHTPGSICLKMENNLFTGDTFIKSVKTVTKLPGGNKKDLEESMQKLKIMEFYKLNLYCGHGE
jgi:glyoxylase-like metal-dependent hydrolase (beta-lactamase superfamily II)